MLRLQWRLAWAATAIPARVLLPARALLLALPARHPSGSALHSRALRRSSAACGRTWRARRSSRWAARHYQNSAPVRTLRRWGASRP
eukprot:2263594-Prymnesium_polylepis.1